MKQLFQTFWGLFLLAGILTACNDETSEHAPVAPLRQVTAEAQPGAVLLRWELPDDPNCAYVTLSYRNPATERQVNHRIEAGIDSFLVENMLNRYGAYAFRLRPFTGSGEGGDIFLKRARCFPTAPYYTTGTAVPITLQASQLSTNAPEEGEGPLSNLLDGDGATYFQSRRSTQPLVRTPHYIQIQLAQPVQGVELSFTNRNTGTARHWIVDLEVAVHSNRSETGWETLGRYDEIFPAPPVSDAFAQRQQGAVFSTPVPLVREKPFRYIRLIGTETCGGDDYYFSLAELTVKEVPVTFHDPENATNHAE